MSYFKLKCVYCLRSFASEKVNYKIDASDIEDKIEYDDDSVSSSNDELDFGASSAMRGMGEDSFDDYDSTSENFITGDQFSEYSQNAAPILKRDIKFPKFIADSEIENGTLCVGYDVEGLKIGSKLYDGKILKRYCPYCKKRLLDQTGIVPIYTITMIGHSTAGKTVFLTMEYFANNHNRLNSKVHNGVINVFEAESHIEKDEKDVIFEKANSFESKGEFPPTTQRTPIPHCLTISYRKNNGKESVESSDTTTCIICYRDAVGEHFTQTGEQAKTNENEETVRMCRMADGLMVLTDPSYLSVPRHKNPKGNEDAVSILTMQKNLSNIFNSITDAVDKPTVALLTKIDDIYLNRDSFDVSVTNPVIAPDLKSAYFIEENKNWARNIFLSLNNNTKQLMTELDKDGRWAKTIEHKFTGAAYIPVSSIGSEVRILELDFPNENGSGNSIKKIVTPEDYDSFKDLYDRRRNDPKALLELKKMVEERPVPIDSVKPRFIELPLFYFLMRFNIIPPMNMEIYADNAEANYKEWYKKCAMINCLDDEDFENAEEPVYTDGHSRKSIFSNLFRKFKGDRLK